MAAQQTLFAQCKEQLLELIARTDRVSVSGGNATIPSSDWSFFTNGLHRLQQVIDQAIQQQTPAGGSVPYGKT